MEKAVFWATRFKYMYEIKLEKFEGPLDLLLRLIERQELNITDVSLAHVTEQYLQYLEKNDQLPPEELADFLVVAAKLLLLKSRVLLPDLFIEDEEEGIGLAEQLAIYRRFVVAGRYISRRFRQRFHSYARERLPMLETITFSPPADLGADDLHQAFAKILEDLREFVRPLPELIKRTISLQDKITFLRKVLVDSPEVQFQRLLENAASRMEIIITFLAILELIKQQYVVARQDNNGAGIVLVQLEQLSK